jgi:hypothetical protein
VRHHFQTGRGFHLRAIGSPVLRPRSYSQYRLVSGASARRIQARAALVRLSPIQAHGWQHRTRADQRLETEPGVISPLAHLDDCGHLCSGRREAKAEKATELLASQFVPVFSEAPVVEEPNLFQRWFSEKEKGRKTVFRPNFRPNSCKWLRGRDLNPRPLGYECNFLVARSFVF